MHGCRLTLIGATANVYRYSTAEVLIGRGVDAVVDPVPPDFSLLDVPKQFASVSRKHAHLKRVGDGYRLDGLGKHGTFVNGELLTGPRDLQTGDRVRLGPEGPEFEYARVADAEGAGASVDQVLCNGCNQVLQRAEVPLHLCPARKTAPQRAKEAAFYAMETLVRGELHRRFVALYFVTFLLLGGLGTAVWWFWPGPPPPPGPAPVSKYEPHFDDDALARAVYRVTFLDESGNVAGGGTAFAVTGRVLATNCHITRALHELAASSWKLERADGSGTVLEGSTYFDKLEDDGRWPAMEPSYDVGLIFLNADVLTSHITLAHDNKPPAFERKMPIWVFGFPGVMGYERLNAVLTNGIVSMADANEPGLFWHTATSGPGNSGSPVINVDGKVVGVLAGGREYETVRAVPGNEGTALATTTIPSGYSYAIKVEVLRDLLQRYGVVVGD